MFLTMRRIALPTELICGNFIIKFVEKKTFRCVNWDKLNFARQVSNT